jgi:predicted RNase H-like nuclease
MMDIGNDNPWLAGVDGCSVGWIVVLARLDGDETRVITVGHFADIFALPEAPAIVAVDMPIGLPARSPPKGRLAESAVRPLLGDRKTSVFRIPSRSAIYAGVQSTPSDPTERFFRACEIARDTSEDRKAFAKQGFYIFPKIVQIDQLLRDRKELVGRVFEIHPELAFWRLNGDQPLREPKKVKSRVHGPGVSLRRTLLSAAGLPSAIINADPPSGAGVDDLLDALACVAIARRIKKGIAKSYPDQPSRDDFDLPMAIWA